MNIPRRASCRVLLMCLWLVTGPIVLPNGTGVSMAARIASPSPAGSAYLRQHFNNLPLTFEENRGQTDARVRFLARGPGYTLFFTRNDLFLRRAPVLPMTRIRTARRSDSGSLEHLHFLGSAIHPRLLGLDETGARANYFLGSDPHHWRIGVPLYRRVEFRNIYPGINLIFRGSTHRLEYNWVLAPHADPRVIRLQFDGPGRVKVNSAGALQLYDGATGVQQDRPVVVLPRGHGQRLVTARYHLEGQRIISFHLGTYDHNQPQIMDPVLWYSTYLGGSNYEWATSIAVDNAGHSYVAGSTASLNFPLVKPLQSTNGGGTEGIDAFVARLSADDNALLYSTYLGGNDDDGATAIAVTNTGVVSLAGFTRSTNFPVARPLGTLRGNRCNRASPRTISGFVAQIAPAGNQLLFGLCLGGNNATWATGITVLSDGGMAVTGATSATDFPLIRPLQAQSGGHIDAFLLRLAPAGRQAMYSTYLGGHGDDQSNAIAADTAGNVYITGSTDSTDYPSVHPLQVPPHEKRTGTQVFITKVNPTGQEILYSTVFGGSDEDAGYGIALDVTGNIYVAGATRSVDFPTVNAVQSTRHGNEDAFVSKLTPDGATLAYSTYLGGSKTNMAAGIAVDNTGSAYVAGSSNSPDFPVVHAVQSVYGGGQYYGDAFVSKVSPAGNSLDYSTYLGGGADDTAQAIAVDTAHNVYIAGGTSSDNFPTTHALIPSRPERGNAFIAKIVDGGSDTTAHPWIAIDQVVLLHRNKQGQTGTTSLLHVKEVGVFIVVYRVESAAGLVPAAHLSIVRNGKTIYSGPMTNKKLTTGLSYFYLSRRFGKTAPTGHLMARFTVSLGAINNSRSLRFTLKT